MDVLKMASKLRQLRRAKKVTQSEVARYCGVAPSAYAMYETGERIPRDDVKAKLSNYFGMPVGYIFFDENAHLK